MLLLGLQESWAFKSLPHLRVFVTSRLPGNYTEAPGVVPKSPCSPNLQLWGHLGKERHWAIQLLGKAGTNRTTLKYLTGWQSQKDWCKGLARSIPVLPYCAWSKTAHCKCSGQASGGSIQCLKLVISERILLWAQWLSSGKHHYPETAPALLELKV